MKKQINRKYKTLEEFEKELNFSEQEWKEIEEETQRIIARMNFQKNREKRSLTQEELAQKAGLPRSTITRFESGKANPTLENLYKIASAMDMKLEVRLVPMERAKVSHRFPS
jgi:DNA-binding XRE family transcriptional regulator